MASLPVFGATIVEPNHKDARAVPALTPAASQYSLDLTETQQLVPPRSPFYQHPPASNERIMNNKKSLDVGVTEKGPACDGLTPISTNTRDPFSSSISVNANKECAMWPSKQTLAQQNQAEKKKKLASKWCGCAGPRQYWSSLSKKQKLVISLALAILIIGAMIGLGVGISKRVNGSYYSSHSSKST